MKKMVCYLLSVILFFHFPAVVSAFGESSDLPDATTSSVHLNASDKIAFAKEMDAAYAKGIANNQIKTATTEAINSLIEEYTFASEYNKASIAQELASYGAYVYGSEIIKQSRSGSNDVTLTAPSIVYLAESQEWKVSCGGHWLNQEWWEQLSAGNVGGKDAFGVGFTQTNTYRSSVTESYAYITDHDNFRTTTTTSRSNGDGSSGFGFQLQDQIVTKGALTYYVGYKWYASCTYDENFASYSGVATGYYIHTYDNAYISSITFGLDGETAGIEATVVNEGQSFPAYSNDTVFGEY